MTKGIMICGERRCNWRGPEPAIFTATTLREEIAKAELRGLEARPVCLWNNVDGCWETTCGNAFEINDGTPAENNMTYCCYCGGKVKARVRAALEEPT